jgi:hypothetical protein
MANQARNFISIAVTAYVVLYPVCSAALTSLPTNVFHLLMRGYYWWFGLWFVSLCWLLWRFRGISGPSLMDKWWWYFVPYSTALPALAIPLGLRAWGMIHFWGLIILPAYATVPLSLIWALVALFRMDKIRGAKLKLAAIPVMLVLWKIAAGT